MPSATIGESLSDRWRGFRDWVLAQPGFRRWAAAFPLTRPIANRQARALFDLCAGFVYSQILLACVRLSLFDMLHAKPLTTREIAQRSALPLDAAERLVAAAISLQLLDRRSGDRIGVGRLGAAMIGNPGIAAMIEHHALLYADLQDPVALLKRGQSQTALGHYWPYARTDQPISLSADQVSAYSTLMAASQAMIAEEVIAAYPFRRHRCLLDVGGGEGAFISAVATRWSNLHFMLFDLPAVVERARIRFAENSIETRVSTMGGDFFADPLPSGADIVSFVRILHDHDDDAVLRLLKAAHGALPDQGTVLIAEPMSGTPGAEPIGDAYFGFYLLAMGQGRPRTHSHLETMLRSAGFTEVQHRPTRQPMLTNIISAKKIIN